MPVALHLDIPYKLDNGNTIYLKMYGDEFLNWRTDARGNTIVSARDGTLHYARWHDEFQAFEPLELVTADNYTARQDDTVYPDVLAVPPFDIRAEIVRERRSKYRNVGSIPDPTKPETCCSCPTSYDSCDPMCEAAHRLPDYCKHDCSSCSMSGCCCHEEEEVEVPDPFVLKTVEENSIVRPIMPIYVRFAHVDWGSPSLDLPNYYIEDQVIAKEKFTTMANYWHTQTRGAVKLVNLGIHYVVLDTPARNYAQHLDDVYDDIVYPALQQVVMKDGVDFRKYRRCCDKYRPCRIDPTTCTPLFIVHGWELSAGCVGTGVWGHARWGLGSVTLGGVEYCFDTYMVVGAFQDSIGALTAERAIADIEPIADDSTLVPKPYLYVPPACAHFMQPGTLVHEAGHALFYLQDLYDADGSTAYGLASSETTEYGKADIVLLIDSSGSMPPYMEKVKESISSFANSLTEKGISDWYIGIAQYYKDNYAIHNDTTNSTAYPEWSSTPAGAQTQADALYQSGGSVHQGEAITYALSNYPWRADAMAKYIVLITDAGTGEGDGGGPVSISEAADACVEANTTVCVVCTEGNRPYFEELETKTGGIYIELSSTVSFGTVLSNKVAHSIRSTITLKLDDALPGFGMWSPMAYGNWGMHPDTPLVPGEMPTNMDAYSLYRIQPRLTTPQWTSGDKTIQNPYAPHSMMLVGESDELVHETYLLQLRDYESYDSGLVGYWSASGQLDTSNTDDMARILPGVLVVHDWDNREPIMDAEHMPADIHEAHGVNQNLKCIPTTDVKNYADPEDLFGNENKSFGDDVADPDDLMVSVREGTVAGFNATDITYVPRSEENSNNSVTYTLSINGPAPVEWNDMSKWPDDLLKPRVPDDCAACGYCYFGAHYRHGCHPTTSKRLFRYTK